MGVGVASPFKIEKYCINLMKVMRRTNFGLTNLLGQHSIAFAGGYCSEYNDWKASHFLLF